MQRVYIHTLYSVYMYTLCNVYMYTRTLIPLNLNNLEFNILRFNTLNNTRELPPSAVFPSPSGSVAPSAPPLGQPPPPAAVKG